MCIVCCRHNESYIGQIDLEDIRVICNRAVASPGVWSTNIDSGMPFTNAGAVDLLHQKQLGDCTILNNQRVTTVKPCSDTTAGAASDACDAGSSDVVVENGRIVLQYRNNVYSSNSANTPTKVHQPDTADRTGTGHVVSAAGKSQADLEYDMNDVVWKNMAASST